MTERYRFSGVLACAILIAVALIIGVQRIDLGGASKLVRPPETGVGTRCAQGDEKSCMELCEALSDVSTITCVDHLAQVFPRVHDGSRLEALEGGGTSTNGSAPSSIPPPSPNGGGGTGGGGTTTPTPAPKPEPKPEPPPTTTTPQQRCQINALGIRVCLNLTP